MSNIADLKAALITEAANITDSIDKLECLSAIDSWYACRTAADTLSSTDISSYSIAGRSVTRQQLPQLREEEKAWLGTVKMWLGRAGHGVMDMSESDEENNSVL